MPDLKTPVFDWGTGDFMIDLQSAVTTTTAAEAVAQIIIKATQTIRGVFSIYANLDDPQLDHKYGNDTQWTLIQDMPEAARISEITRNVYDALIYDPWITEVKNLEILRTQVVDTHEWAYFCSCTVLHIYGTTNLEGVSLTNG